MQTGYQLVKAGLELHYACQNPFRLLRTSSQIFVDLGYVLLNNVQILFQEST